MQIEQKPPMPARSYASPEEMAGYRKLIELTRRSPIPEREMLANLGLFLTRGSLARILFMHNLYLKMLHAHGVIVEFGVRWGQNLALLATFRHLYEPYNMSRKIVGFDTFNGILQVSAEDGDSETARPGMLSVAEDYEDYLEELLSAHEQLAPRSHLRKFELVRGDVSETLPAYLLQHPETIIAFAYFDLCLHRPTRRCLELIRPHLTKGSIVGFDELVLEEYPGETIALKEAWGVDNYRICRDPISPQQSYLIFE